MDYLIYFGIIFIVIFILYYFLLYGIKLKNKIFNKTREVKYLIMKFKLDPSKMENKKVGLVIALLNATIIASVCTIISIINVKFGYQMLIGFVLLLSLIYALYEIYGRILVKKGWEKDV